MFQLWYWMGGYQNGSWRAALPVATLAEAQAMKASVERGGRPAVIQTEKPEGVPVGWDFNGLRWAA